MIGAPRKEKSLELVMDAVRRSHRDDIELVVWSMSFTDVAPDDPRIVASVYENVDRDVYDLRLAAWTRRPYDTRDGDPQRVARRLTGRLAPGDILLLHDGHAASMADGRPVILAVLPRLLATLNDHQLTPVTLHDATS